MSMAIINMVIINMGIINMGMTTKGETTFIPVKKTRNFIKVTTPRDILAFARLKTAMAPASPTANACSRNGI